MGTVGTAYAYDPVNRLSVAAENSSSPSNPPCPDTASSWCRGYNYYAGGHGNRQTSAYSGQGLSTLEPASFNANNQIADSGWQYTRGNVTQQKTGETIGYDAENRQTSFCGVGGCTTYTYDGNGRRVMSQGPGGTAVFVYDAAGNLAAEYSSAAPSSLCTTCYLTTDHLGSTRVVTDQSGCAVSRQDYLPFGRPILSSTGSPRLNATGQPVCATNGYVAAANPSRQQFTGQELDTESNLYYFNARYFSSAQGRFMSADIPLTDQDPANPQSWNLYGYVRNNPLRSVDPTGRTCQTATHPDGSSNQVDDGDGKGCAAAEVAPTQNQQPPKQHDATDIKPQQVTTTAKQEPFSVSALVSGAKDYLSTSQIPLTVSVGVGAPFLENSIGPQVTIAVIPKTRKICLSGGLYVARPGSDFVNFNAGALAIGPLNKAEDVVSGFGVSGTLQDTEGRGYQVSSSSSGTLGGPSFGTRGTSVSAGYGGCFTVGR